MVSHHIARNPVEPQLSAVPTRIVLEAPPHNQEHLSSGIVDIGGGKTAVAVAPDCVDVLFVDLTELRSGGRRSVHGYLFPQTYMSRKWFSAQSAESPVTDMLDRAL